MNPAAAVAPVPLRDLVPWMAIVPVLLLVIWLTGFDQGELSRAGAVLHEFMHDGRHLLSAPCH